MSGFVKFIAEAPGRTLEMIAPVERAWDALWDLAAELPKDMTYRAVPWPDLDLRRSA